MMNKQGGILGSIRELFASSKKSDQKDYVSALELYPTHEPARKALEDLDRKESKA